MDGHGQHHLHMRKRLYQNLEPVPHTEAFKRFFDRFIYGVGIIGPALFLPQILRIYTLQDATDFSLITWVLLSCLNGTWVIYGILHREPAIIFSQTMFLVAHAFIIVGILLYG